jgi:GAF domain-containing protein
MEQDEPESSAALRQQLTTALRREESLRRVIESISSELALEPLLTRIVASAVELIGAQYGSIGLVVVRPDGLAVRIAAIHNMPPQELGAEIPTGVGLAGRVLLTRQPLWLDRYGDLDQPTLPALAEHAVIGVPISWGEQMLGFFGIGAEPPRRFNADDHATLALFARHAAIAIKNAHRYEGEQHRAIRLATINRIGQLITSSLNLREVFQTAVEAIHHDLDFAYVAAGLVDPDDPEWLVLYAHIGVYAASVPDDYRQSIHEGVVGTAARTRRQVLVNNVATDARYLPLLQSRGIHAELALPIIADDQLLGVLNIESERTIVAEDVEGVAIIADQLATAIQNASRYEQEQRRTARLELIARIGQRLTAHRDPDELFATTVDELHGRLGYEHVALLLRDSDASDWLVLRACASRWPQPDAPSDRRPLHAGLIGAAARQRSPALENTLTAEVHDHVLERRAELVVPIVLGERLLGVLDLAGSRPFRSEDVTGLQVIADQLAVAVDQAQLLADTQRALGETHLLYETSRRIGAALDSGAMIVAYLQQIGARGPFDCAVALRPEQPPEQPEETLEQRDEPLMLIVRGRWRAARRTLDLAAPSILTTAGLADPVSAELRAGQTITIDDVQSDVRIDEAFEAQLANIGSTTGALALIPLLARGAWIGVVALSVAQPHAWSAAELQVYQAAAGQLAIALDNRRQQRLLYERRRLLAVIEERQRLARELHDSVTQLLFSITLIAQTIVPGWQHDPAEGQQRVARLLELSQQAHVEMRALLAELRPPEQVTLTQEPPAASYGAPMASIQRIQQAGLPGALRQHLDTLTRDGLQIDFIAADYPRQPAACEEALFRITQEALHNIVKHARARNVTIRLTSTDKAVRLWIKDDGIGFTPGDDQQAAGHGLGLRSMRERAAALGGSCTLHSARGSGTTIEALVPRHDEDS